MGPICIRDELLVICKSTSPNNVKSSIGSSLLSSYWGVVLRDARDALIEYFMVIQKILKKMKAFAMFIQSAGAQDENLVRALGVEQRTHVIR